VDKIPSAPPRSGQKRKPKIRQEPAHFSALALAGIGSSGMAQVVGDTCPGICICIRISIRILIRYPGAVVYYLNWPCASAPLAEPGHHCVCVFPEMREIESKHWSFLSLVKSLRVFAEWRSLSWMKPVKRTRVNHLMALVNKASR